jgi:hypothetical protein
MNVARRFFWVERWYKTIKSSFVLELICNFTDLGELDSERGAMLQPRNASHLIQHHRRADLLRQLKLQWYLCILRLGTKILSGIKIMFNENTKIPIQGRGEAT